MEDSVNLQLVRTEPEGGTSPAPVSFSPCDLVMRSSAGKLAHTLAWIPGERESRDFADRCRNLVQTFKPLLAALESTPASSVFDDLQELHENVHLIEGELQRVCQTFQPRHKVAQVRTPDGHVISRIAAVADDYLAASGYQFSESGFTAYIRAFQQVSLLNVAELWMLIPVLKLVLLEHVAKRAALLLRDRNHSDGAHDLLASLQEIRQTSWKVVIEPLILFDQVLRQDPAGAYSRMDYDSRELYRRKVVDIADHCDCSEMKVASEVLSLARRAKQQTHQNPRSTERYSHVGSYLIAEGTEELEEGIRGTVAERIGSWIRQRPDDFYLPGIAVLTVAIVSSVVVLLTEPSTSLGLIFLALLAVLLPSSQSAIQIMNYVASLLITAQILPKLDFSEGLPDDCVTMVAIPTMLLNEKQVRHLANALEVRFLGNQDRNLHFLLLTDLPDSPSEPVEENALVDLAADLIRKLNEKYAPKRMGSFFFAPSAPCL